MRGVWLAVVVATGCSFSPNPAGSGTPKDAPPGGGDDQDDAAVHDGPEIDAAPLVCGAQYDHTNPVTGVHYRFTDDKTWVDADTDCKSDGGQLAKIETGAENQYIFLQTPVDMAFTWIGLYDKTNTDAYVWDDDTPLGTFENFNSDVPLSPDKNCVDMADKDGTWSAWYCDPLEGSNGPLQPGICECHDG